MKLFKLAEFLEISFWKMLIPLMSISRLLLALIQPVFDYLFNQRSKKVLFHSAVLAGSGLTLGFMLGLIRAILW
jgi:hypothetical protein